MNFVFTKYFKKKSPQGFSLAEVILSGFVLTVGLLVISALMTKSLKNSFETRDAIIAILLAQEGAELVRNVRDNDFAADGTGFPSSSFNSNAHCRMSYSDDSRIDGIDCLGVGYEPNNNKGRYYLQYYVDTSGIKVYKHTGVQGKFSRYIHIQYDGTVGEENAKVKSFVYWGSDAPAGIDSGDITHCNISNQCVYTENFLTSWN